MCMLSIHICVCSVSIFLHRLLLLRKLNLDLYGYKFEYEVNIEQPPYDIQEKKVGCDAIIESLYILYENVSVYI